MLQEQGPVWPAPTEKDVRDGLLQRERENAVALQKMDKRDLLAFAVFCGDWETDSRLDPVEKERLLQDRQMDGLLAHWVKNFMPARDEPHCGDCTNVPCACIRCQVDWWYDIADNILAVIPPETET